MPTTRELDRLTEGWPDDEANFELQRFAGTFRAERPELSAPALDRIKQALRHELDQADTRATWPTPRQPRLARFSRVGVAGAKRIATSPRTLHIVPLAAAASVLLGIGVWLGYRPGQDTQPHGVSTSQPKPPAPRMLIKERPSRDDRLTPDGPQFHVP
jgi:hypothetical protein